ncbi:MAG TPA: hypothetical protein VK524_25755 [Polyangiaceae bacterium]|nr:hypothetical protein [Polyangiaceae bacterium]
MNIEIKRFLALTTLLAAGSAAVAGCVVSSDDDDDDDGTGGTAGVGASGGAAGTGGSSGAAGTGGYAGTGGSGGSAGWDGSAGSGGDSSVCFGNSRTTDASLSGACEALPYFDLACGEEGLIPLAADACLTMQSRARPGVFEEFVKCIQQIPEGVACQDGGFQLCDEAVFPKACPRPIAIENATGWTQETATCERMNTRCPDLSVAECQSYLSALTQDGAEDAFFCWDPASRDADCYDAFRECFFLEEE